MPRDNDFAHWQLSELTSYLSQPLYPSISKHKPDYCLSEQDAQQLKFNQLNRWQRKKAINLKIKRYALVTKLYNEICSEFDISKLQTEDRESLRKQLRHVYADLLANKMDKFELPGTIIQQIYNEQINKLTNKINLVNNQILRQYAAIKVHGYLDYETLREQYYNQKRMFNAMPMLDSQFFNKDLAEFSDEENIGIESNKLPRILLKQGKADSFLNRQKAPRSTNDDSSADTTPRYDVKLFKSHKQHRPVKNSFMDYIRHGYHGCRGT